MSDELDEVISDTIKEATRRAIFPKPDYSQKKEYKQTITETDPNAPEPKYMKQKIEFNCILSITVYPNGMVGARVSRPLQPKMQFEPKKKKIGKATIEFKGAKSSTLDLG